MCPSDQSFAIRRQSLALAVVTYVLIAIPSINQTAAQDAFLFGAGQEPADPPSAVRSESTDPVIANLMAMAGRGDEQFAAALIQLARGERWQQVNQLLERLASQRRPDGALAIIQQQIGPDVYLQMRTSGQLSEKATTALDALAIASRQFRQSPDRLRAAVKRLDRESTDDRLAAARILAAGGNASIIELIDALVGESVTDDETILRALLRQGDGGVAALRQLALYGSRPVRASAVSALARINAREHIADLLTALHRSNASPEEVAAAGRALVGITGDLPSRRVAVDRLLVDLQRQQEIADRWLNDGETITVWTVTGAGDAVAPAKTREIFLAYRDVADAAARLRSIGAVVPQVLGDLLIAEIGYRVVIDPDWGDTDQIQSLRDAYGNAWNTEALSNALRASLQNQQYPAALGLIRAIDVQVNHMSSEAVLAGSGSQESALVQAVSSSFAQLRFEAALSAARLAGASAYPGSSRVRRTLSEMSRLTNQPLAILVETRPEVVSPLQNVISRLGLEAVPVANVSQLLQRITQGGDIRLIISKTALADLSPIELIDKVRRTDRGRHIPIVFYADRSPADGISISQLYQPTRRWEGPIRWIDHPTTPAAFDGVLDEVELQQHLPSLSPVDRLRFRREAKALLGRDG